MTPPPPPPTHSIPQSPLTMVHSDIKPKHLLSLPHQRNPSTNTLTSLASSTKVKHFQNTNAPTSSIFRSLPHERHRLNPPTTEDAPHPPTHTIQETLPDSVSLQRNVGAPTPAFLCKETLSAIGYCETDSGYNPERATKTLRFLCWASCRTPLACPPPPPALVLEISSQPPLRFPLACQPLHCPSIWLFHHLPPSQCIYLRQIGSSFLELDSPEFFGMRPFYRIGGT